MGVIINDKFEVDGVVFSAGELRRLLEQSRKIDGIESALKETVPAAKVLLDAANKPAEPILEEKP